MKHIAHGRGWEAYDEDHDTRADAESDLSFHPACPSECRIVRLLSPAESRRKAAATALREFAIELRMIGFETLAGMGDERADALWPRKGAGR